VSHLPHLRTSIPGPKSRALAGQLHNFESRNITAITDDWPIFWERALDANVWDADGNRYIDLTAGFGVANVGHSNSRVVAAIQKQSKRLLHAMGDVHPNELKLQLAHELVELTFGRWNGSEARVIFATSGSDAVEAALKTAALRTKRPGVIAFTSGFHGLSYGALAGTWRFDFKTPFDEQISKHVVHVPYGVVPAAENDPCLPQPIENYGAILVEPIQGRGGIVVPPDNFLPGLRKLCDETGMLLIVDEIYEGFCRTGRWFACEHWNVVPDIICVGKSLAGGLPLSACIGSAKVMSAWPESTGEAIHTSTFLGNPLACAAGLAAIGEMKRLQLCARAENLGEHLRKRLGKLRGKGLFLGLEAENVPELCVKLLRRGIIAIPEGNNAEVLGIIPPLTITKQQLDHAGSVLADLLR
jgi:4-aminobutyrate aminotransferase-like enzyme